MKVEALLGGYYSTLSWAEGVVNFDLADLWGHIIDVKTPLMLSAFAIAAVLSAFNIFARKPTATVRRALWVVVGAMCLIAILPVIASSFERADVIYRVRVIAVEAATNTPIAGATVRVTAGNENKTNPDGSCELAIPRGSLPTSGKVTIFADQSARFLHGSAEISLGSDPNPSLIIPLVRNRSAEIRGMVQDQEGHALKDVRVNIPGTRAVVTDDSGTFDLPLPAQIVLGERLLVHSERLGYKSWDQSVSAGDPDVVITLKRDSKERNIKR